MLSPIAGTDQPVYINMDKVMVVICSGYKNMRSDMNVNLQSINAKKNTTIVVFFYFYNRFAFK
jgi:hypothetical protein